MLDFAKQQANLLDTRALDQIAEHCERTAALLLPHAQEALIKYDFEYAEQLYSAYDTFQQLTYYIEKVLALQGRVIEDDDEPRYKLGGTEG